MTGYNYGATHGRMSLADRQAMRRLEQRLREKDAEIDALKKRIRQIRGQRDALDTNYKPYRERLTANELNTPPVLHPGDTPAKCLARLQAGNAEAAEVTARKQRATNQSRKRIAA